MTKLNTTIYMIGLTIADFTKVMVAFAKAGWTCGEAIRKITTSIEKLKNENRLPQD